MIGGHDICFHTDTPAQAAEGAIRIVHAAWPDAVVENAENGEIQSHCIGVGDLSAESLIYKNASARDSWMEKGAVAENSNLMVHLICGEDSLTIVVDELAAGEISAIIAAIREHVYQDIFWMRADAA